MEIGSTDSTDNFFSNYYKDIIEHSNRHLCSSFRFQNNKSYVFSSKNFELQGNQFIVLKIVNLKHREIHNFYKNQYSKINKCRRIESNYDVKHIQPKCQFGNCNNDFFGNVDCPNEICSEKCCVRKKTFQSFGRSDYQWPQYEFLCQVLNIFKERRTVSFQLMCNDGLFFRRDVKIISRFY